MNTINLLTIGVVFFALFFLVYLIWGRADQLKAINHQVRQRRARQAKSKQPPLPPLKLKLDDTWVKCQLDCELTIRQYQTIVTMLYISFFDAGGQKVFAESYSGRKAAEYVSQIGVILHEEGFEQVEHSSYRESTKTIYERQTNNSA